MRLRLVLLASVAVCALLLYFLTDNTRQAWDRLGRATAAPSDAAAAAAAASLGAAAKFASPQLEDAPVVPPHSRADNAAKLKPWANPPAQPPRAKAAPGAARAQQDAPFDPRFHIRWGKPGLCARTNDASVVGAHDSLVQSFRVLESEGVRMRIAPHVTDDVAHDLAAELHHVAQRMAEVAQMPITTPPLLVYASVQDLRNTACVNPAAVAYYDGALHVSADASAQEQGESLRHELIHHALISRGVHGPMWLQEGLAMLSAGEDWWREPRYGLLAWGLRSHYPFAKMVAAFPHSAAQEFATAAYFQSLMMVHAVIAARNYDYLWSLVRDVGDGLIQPQDAFAEGLGTFDAQEQEEAFQRTVRRVVAMVVEQDD